MATTQVELAVQMNCQGCADDLRNVISSTKGIQSLNINVPQETVVVETTLRADEIKSLIESTGRRAVIKGQGAGVNHLGAAVCMISGHHNDVIGVIRITQTSMATCVIEGTVDGLPEGKHGFHIHEFGDISSGPDSCGDHFNPLNVCHGSRTDSIRHVGDLGNIEANANGRATFRFSDEKVKVWDVIGRSMVISANEDDLGHGENESSKVDGCSGSGLACGIIARSSGLFQNAKIVCACDGISLWDERDVPLAGPGRQSRKMHAAAL